MSEYLKSSKFFEFVYNDIIREINKCKIIEIKEEKAIILQTSFRKKQYQQYISKGMVDMCLKYNAKETLNYLVNMAVKQMVIDICLDISKQ